MGEGVSQAAKSFMKAGLYCILNALSCDYPHPQIIAYMGCFAPLPPSSLETKLSVPPSSSSSSLHPNFPTCNQNSLFSTKQGLLLLSHSHLQQTIIN